MSKAKVFIDRYAIMEWFWKKCFISAILAAFPISGKGEFKMPTINFKGKSFIKNHHLTVKYHELIPDEAASLTTQASLHDNLIIHGDNLIALKALLPNFGKSVKCIYIDPPYNTGQEKWRYSD